MGYYLNLFDIVYGLLTLCLITIFAVAAGAKLRDVQRALEGLLAFGIPERWSRPVLFALASLELLIAALLVYPATRAAGAWCALGALAVFSLAIGWQLAHGNRPACACFGALSRSSIGWRSIARNLVLMALAGAVLALPTAGVATASLTVSVPALLGLLWTAIGVVWLLLLTRQNGRLLSRIQQLERVGRPGATNSRQPIAGSAPLQVGAAVPPLGLSDARGRPVDIATWRGTAVVLLFLDSACSHCRPLLEFLAQRRPTGAMLAVVSDTDALRHRVPGELAVLVDPLRASAALFGVRGTPAAVLLDDTGALAQVAVHGTTPVRALLEQYTIGEVRHEWAPV